MEAVQPAQPSTVHDEAPDSTAAPQAGDGEDQENTTAAINADGGLTEAQLLEIFKQTSVFNVRSALAGNEALMGGAEEGYEHER